MRGAVKWYNEAKGFGYIATDATGDVFVHHTQVSGPQRLQEGQLVAFSVVKGPKGLQAQGVTVLQR